jgi:leader peptidase (prepilin peptidase)/N-methyltransferase
MENTLVAFSFIFGLVIGSFLNVCIYRLPLGNSILYPASSCPRCGSKIRFYDNVPLVSYILLRGKCRFCRHPISFRYPVVEFLSGLVSVALFLRYGPSFAYLFLFAFTASLITMTFIDLQHQILPDVITIPGIVTGFFVSFFSWSEPSWSDSLFGILGGGVIFYLVAILFKLLRGKEGLGAGDIKLLAMLGGWLGWQALPFVILISSVTGVIIGGGTLLLSRKKLETRIPYGPFLVLAAFVWLFFKNVLVGLL